MLASPQGKPVRLGQFIVTPETRSALLAVKRLAKAVEAGKALRDASPLFLHGPPGVGKSHLAVGLQAAVSGTQTVRTARIIAAGDLNTDDSDLGEIAACDLLVIEDVQHTVSRAHGTFGRLVDRRIAAGKALLLTANSGPAQLRELPPRTSSLLGAGLVVGLELPSQSTRRYLLERLAQRDRIGATSEVLDWLSAQSTGGVRSLLGALNTLRVISAGSPRALSLNEAKKYWPAGSPTPTTPNIDRIVRHVAKYYSVDPKEIGNRSRLSRTLWPAQVAMYLVREQTGLPWTRIGDAFGGRDAATVRHAVRKVELRSGEHPPTASALRQLAAEVA